MNCKITKKTTSRGDRYEVRAWDGVGDERMQLRRRFHSRAEAQNFIDERLYREREARKLALRSGCANSTLTFGDEVAFWKQCKSSQLSPAYLADAELFEAEFAPDLSTKRISELTPQLVRRLEAALYEKGNAPSTVKKKLAWLKSVLNFSVESERIPFNPIAKVKTGRVPKQAPESWDKAEASSFLEFARAKYAERSDDAWIYLVYLIALNTGLRASELWALKPSCIRSANRQLLIREQFDIRKRVFRELKGRESRLVPLQPDLSKELSQFVAAHEVGQSQVLFQSEQGTPIDHNNFKNRFFERDVKEWGGRRITFHGLRHTAATLMLDAGVDVRTVQEILGHKDIQTTMRYVHALGKNIANAALTYFIQPAATPACGKIVATNEFAETRANANSALLHVSH